MKDEDLAHIISIVLMSCIMVAIITPIALLVAAYNWAFHRDC
jgi:hypothetical protein